MKIKWKLLLFGGLLLVLSMTNPSDEKFTEWLKVQHGISCGVDGICYHTIHEKRINSWSQGIHDGYMFFTLTVFSYTLKGESEERN